MSEEQHEPPSIPTQPAQLSPAPGELMEAGKTSKATAQRERNARRRGGRVERKRKHGRAGGSEWVVGAAGGRSWQLLKGKSEQSLLEMADFIVWTLKVPDPQ